MSADHENTRGDLPAADRELAAIRRQRLEADWALPMSDRLARVHELCCQMAELRRAPPRR